MWLYLTYYYVTYFKSGETKECVGSDCYTCEEECVAALGKTEEDCKVQCQGMIKCKFISEKYCKIHQV